jgi:hypothetical protein
LCQADRERADKRQRGEENSHGHLFFVLKIVSASRLRLTWNSASNYIVGK